jgi:hypothetical protein
MRNMLFVILLILTSCHQKQEDHKIKMESNANDKSNIQINKTDSLPAENLTWNNIFTESLKNKFKSKFTDTLNFKEFNNNITTTLELLPEKLNEYIFVTEELQNYREYYSETYCFSLPKSYNHLYPLMTLSENDAGLAVSYFIFDSNMSLRGYFTPTYVESEPEYSLMGYGQFENDSIFMHTAMSIDILEEVSVDTTIYRRDSTIIRYTIKDSGKIIGDTLGKFIDTLYYIKK